MGQVPVPFSVELRLLPNETTVTLRIFTDHTMAEFFPREDGPWIHVFQGE
jgi:hypothetical protein